MSRKSSKMGGQVLLWDTYQRDGAWKDAKARTFKIDGPADAKRIVKAWISTK